MRRSLVLVCLFAIGCGYATAPDTVAAQGYVLRLHSNVDTIVDVDQQPEYAAISNIPGREVGWTRPSPERPAACGVRVTFHWQDGSRKTHDDWIVWVNDDHKAVGWSSNPKRDQWREYVQSVAAK
jgi:hypothetical protein